MMPNYYFWYLSSLASGLSCDEEITGVLCSFLFSSEVFSPPPGSSGPQVIHEIRALQVNTVSDYLGHSDLSFLITKIELFYPQYPSE